MCKLKTYCKNRFFHEEWKGHKKIYYHASYSKVLFSRNLVIRSQEVSDIVFLDWMWENEVKWWRHHGGDPKHSLLDDDGLLVSLPPHPLNGYINSTTSTFYYISLIFLQHTHPFALFLLFVSQLWLYCE